MYVDTKDGKEIIVCTVGTTALHYDYQALADLHKMLQEHGDWMELGSKDEKQEAVEGTVEYWARSSKIQSADGTDFKKGFRGRFAMYIPPLMEELGL